MKRSAFVICTALLALCLLWCFRGRHPKQILSGAISVPSAVVSENGNTVRDGSIGRQGLSETAVVGSQSRSSTQTESNSALQSVLARWQVPIDFYGKIIDESNNAVPGATINFSWTENPTDDAGRAAATKSDSEGLFELHGARGPGLDVRVSKQGYYTSKQDTESFRYAISGNFSPDAKNPIVFHLRKKGTPEPLLKVTGNGLAAMSDYLLSRDGTPTEVSLRDGRQMPIGEGDLRVEVWIGKPLEGYSSRTEWKCRVSVPGGGLIPVEEEYAFLAPPEGYLQSDEWSVNIDRWAEKVEKRYYVMLRDGKFGLVTLRVIGATKPFFRLSSLMNPTGSRNLEPAS